MVFARSAKQNLAEVPGHLSSIERAVDDAMFRGGLGLGVDPSGSSGVCERVRCVLLVEEDEQAGLKVFVTHRSSRLVECE